MKREYITHKNNVFLCSVCKQPYKIREYKTTVQAFCSQYKGLDISNTNKSPHERFFSIKKNGASWSECIEKMKGVL